MDKLDYKKMIKLLVIKEAKNLIKWGLNSRFNGRIKGKEISR